MFNRSPFGLRTRIVVSLALVLVVIIAITELSVSEIVKVTLIKQSSSLVTSVPSMELDAPSWSADFKKMRRMVMFYMIFGAILILGLGSIAITRLVVKPLSKVAEAVQKVADGDLHVEIPLSGSGEIIDLARSFNQMTTTLQEQRDELEKRLKKIEQSSFALKATQDKLIRAAKLASVGTLAAGVAHEIGNPLAGIIGLLDALEFEPDPEQRTRFRALMRKEIERIDRTISDLLHYARPVHAGTEAPNKTDLKETLEQIRSLLGAQKIFDRIELNVGMEEGPISLNISSDELSQLLLNVFLNSAYAMEGTGNLAIRTTQIDHWLPELAVIERRAIQIAIEDSGPGVSPQDAQNIFDPFFTTKSGGDGSGLGLAICQSICERAGGEIRLDEAFKDGARFIITLPLDQNI